MESKKSKKSKKNQQVQEESKKQATQLPTTIIEETKQIQEEVKTMTLSGEKTYTTGSHEAFVEDVKKKLEGIELNALEQGLLERYLQDQDTCAKNVCGLLKKLAAKYEEKDARYELKKIRKVIPLFDEHDFWSTQPVPKYYE